MKRIMKMMSQVREQQNNNIWTSYLLKRSSFEDLDAFVNLILPLFTASGDIASLKQLRKANDRKRQMTLTENRRRLVVRELTHLISKPNTKIKPRIVSDAVIRVLTRFKRELRAMEMESRHAWATMAQLVAAVRPHVLNLRDSVSALRARHEFFVEKTSSEPRKYLHFADVASPSAARDLVLEALVKEMQGISLMTSNIQSEQDYYYCDIFMNANLSSLIWGFLNSNDLRNCGLVSKSFDGARELGKLMTFYSSLETAYRVVTKDFTWLEDALLSSNNVTNHVALDGAIHECIFSQRKVADCIVQMYALYLPTTDRNDDHHLSLVSTSPISTNLANQAFHDKETQSSGFSTHVNRGGLLVRKRKEFGGKEEVPDLT